MSKEEMPACALNPAQAGSPSGLVGWGDALALESLDGSIAVAPP